MIKWLKIFLFFSVVIFALGLGITLAHENKQAVILSLAFYKLPEYSLGVIISITLLVGTIIGLLLSYLPLLLGRHSLRSRDKKIKKLEKEIDQLRAAAIKG